MLKGYVAKESMGTPGLNKPITAWLYVMADWMFNQDFLGDWQGRWDCAG